MAATAFEQPARIGEVAIHTGDYVLADRDGVVVVPQALVEEVVSATEEVLRKENLVRRQFFRALILSPHIYSTEDFEEQTSR